MWPAGEMVAGASVLLLRDSSTQSFLRILKASVYEKSLARLREAF